MRDRLAELGRWESTLAAPGLEFGAWAETERDAAGGLQMPWYRYRPVAEAFIRSVDAARSERPADAIQRRMADGASNLARRRAESTPRQGARDRDPNGAGDEYGRPSLVPGQW